MYCFKNLRLIHTNGLDHEVVLYREKPAEKADSEINSNGIGRQIFTSTNLLFLFANQLIDLHICFNYSNLNNRT